jgi:hypothetical protein
MTSSFFASDQPGSNLGGADVCEEGTIGKGGLTTQALAFLSLSSLFAEA